MNNCRLSILNLEEWLQASKSEAVRTTAVQALSIDPGKIIAGFQE